MKNWKPTPSQSRAAKAIRRRYKAGERVTRVGGYAGTGKTVLLSRLPEILRIDGSRVLYLTPTNMVGEVLRGKLSAVGSRSRVMTLHRKLTTVEGEYHCPPCPGERSCHGVVKRCGCGDPVFLPKRLLEQDYDAIGVDEASMVDEEIHGELMGLAVPIFLFGDPGQLRPIETPNFSAVAELDVELTDQMRQGAGSQILRWADLARCSKFLSGVAIGDANPDAQRVAASVIRRLEWDPDDLTDSVVITNTRLARQEINQMARASLGYTASLVPGDVLVCLENLPAERVYNGTRAQVVECERHGNVYEVEARLVNSDRVWYGIVAREPLGTLDPKPANRRTRAAATVWDYAYGFTAHKAQGSEFRDVTIINFPHASQSFDFRRGRDYRHWLYTAMTRARKTLTVIG